MEESLAEEEPLAFMAPAQSWTIPQNPGRHRKFSTFARDAPLSAPWHSQAASRRHHSTRPSGRDGGAGLECLTSSTRLRFEHWLRPARAETSAFRPNDSRLSRFTEEKQNWSVPKRHRQQRAVALESLQADDGNHRQQSLNCLTISPMGVHSYFPGEQTIADGKESSTTAQLWKNARYQFLNIPLGR